MVLIIQILFQGPIMKKMGQIEDKIDKIDEKKNKKT